MIGIDEMAPESLRNWDTVGLLFDTPKGGKNSCRIDVSDLDPIMRDRFYKILQEVADNTREIKKRRVDTADYLKYLVLKKRFENYIPSQQN